MNRYLVSTILCLASSVFPVRADEAANVAPDAYFGSYLFEDGVRVSGGRFDEAGKQMLLYMDTETVSRGSTLKPLSEEKNKSFILAFGFGDVERATFSDDYDQMRWLMSSGKILNAKRVMKPEIHNANFSNGNTELSGSFYLPPGGKKQLPAVVLAHGSGPTTRYAGTWVTFFLEQGYAVLAYDKRGTGESSGDWKSSTYMDLADDLSAAVRWLRTQEMVDADRVGIHTSSQSGWYGPYTARQNKHVAFLIQRVGPAVSIDVGTAHEIREEWLAEDVPESSIKPAIEFWLSLHELAGKRGSLDQANKMLKEAKSSTWFATTFGEWEHVEKGWWQRHIVNMQLKPACDSAQLDIPILWFLAEKDQNVPYEKSHAALLRAKKHNQLLDIVTVADSPHSFLLRDEENEVRYTDAYWTRMANWLRNEFKSPE